MICSSDRAELCGGPDHLALLLGEVGLGEHLEHAGDADHRRADLVPHRGEERRLRPAGVLGGLARLDRLVLGAARARRRRPRPRRPSR